MFTLRAHRNTATDPTPVERPRAPRRRRRGFTLVEILTVVLILGIASAIIAPQVGSRNDLKVRAAARVLIADLLYAQNMAVAKQQWYYVKFDAAAETYQVMDAAGPAGADHVITNPVTKDPFINKMGPGGNARLGDVRIKSAVFNGEDVTLFPNEFTLAFDELGQPHVYCYDQNDRNPMGDGNVTLHCGAHELTVTVERYTGEITVP